MRAVICPSHIESVVPSELESMREGRVGSPSTNTLKVSPPIVRSVMAAAFE